MLNAPADILHSWRLVEWLTPTSFPKAAPNRDAPEPVYSIRPPEPMPWDAEHPHFRHRCSQGMPRLTADNGNEEWAYGVYAGPIDINVAREEIETWLQDPVSHVVRDERAPQGTAAIGFQVTSEGRVVASSLEVSTFAWAYGLLRHHKSQGHESVPFNALSVDAFEAAKEEIEERFAAELAGALLTGGELDQFLEWLFERLSLPMSLLAKLRCRIQCVRRPAVLRDPPNEDGENKDDLGSDDNSDEALPRLSAALEMLNSLFLKDLARVESAVREGSMGTALAQYLGRSPERHIDLRADRQEAWRLLHPALYPRGRWPGKGRYPLVFSQQVAVNQAFRSLGGDQGGLMAVNGPPGTGKTTLLKDVIAEVIVQRAEVLATYSTPAKAFQSRGKAWESGNWTQWYAPLAPELHGFGIVVASSNNGAVENVTLELPKASDVDPVLSERHSPFTEIGSALLPDEDEAWSLLAAVLGKGENRSAFVEAFWGWESNEVDGHYRAHHLLKGDKPEGILSWGEAVTLFRAALAHEAEVRKQREALYHRVTMLAQWQQELEETSEKLSRTRESMAKLADRLHGAEASLAEAREIFDKARDAVSVAIKQEVRKAQQAAGAARLAHDEAREEAVRSRHTLEELEDQAPTTLMQMIDRHVWRRPKVRDWKKQYADQKILVQQKAENLSRCTTELARADAAAASAESEAQEQLEEGVRAERQALQSAQHLARSLEEKREAIDTANRELEANRRKLLARVTEATQEMQAYIEAFGASCCVTPEVLKKSPAEVEVLAPWGDERWEAARVAVFIAALDLHDAFVYGAGAPLQHNLRGMIQLLRGKAPSDLPKGVAQTLWSSLFLMVPVVSTTFASFSRQFDQLGQETIGWLLIDEAGQAAPQYAAGALWRARSSLVVGDPLQLKPVVTVPDRLQAALAELCGVGMEWRPGATSAQMLADQASQFGSWINETWVGAPLLVHRRCDSPMFEISNAVAYDNAMVHGKPPSDSPLPPSGWLHVPSNNAEGHWIPAEGDAASWLIDQLLELGLAPTEIFMISPFRSVVAKLNKLAGRRPGIKAGTIHTVQGKEAKVVILVLGGDPQRQGAKSWAAEAPNLVNVAVSRAKTRLYVIGDQEAWKQHPYFKECSMLLSAPASVPAQ
ncbi:ATP-binding protein [Halomonas sp. DN3]|uniref:DEAD/DEAH box helicase n=1 Tax=Halomonas sp. DN3 TaxID=2953657 RepID=UPI0020A08D0D|nr:AAA domain-containing protein [Halomonas sp. DN3]USZ49352.1 AAA domain-containing protein [Halomonas sp. DN3]